MEDAADFAIDLAKQMKIWQNGDDVIAHKHVRVAVIVEVPDRDVHQDGVVNGKARDRVIHKMCPPR